MLDDSRDPCSAAALLVLCMVAVLGCDPAEVDGDAGGCEQTSGGAAAMPIAVDCSFVFAGVQTDVSYEPASERTETAVGGKLIASGMLNDDAYDGRAFTMTIYAEDDSVLATSLYQLDPARLPVNEFFGDHGFTGLNMVKDPDVQEVVQFACFARDPGDPPHAWQD